MKLDKNVYIRLRHRIQVKENQKVFLKDIALIHAPEPILAKVERTMIHQVSKKDKNIVIIDGMTIIRAIKEQLPETDIHLIGSQQTIIEVVYKKVKMSTALFLLVWCLLFIGSAFSIMNFHEDVSMQEVHQKLFYLMTGINDPKPLTLQIPYSIGLGLGMILFLIMYSKTD